MEETQTTEQTKTDAELKELTRREKEVLKEIAGGFLYKEIAYRYDISIDTVKKHCKNIYRKMQFRNRKHAAVYYNEAHRS